MGYQVFIPISQELEQNHRQDAGHGQGNNHPEQDSPVGAAVDAGGVVNLTGDAIHIVQNQNGEDGLKIMDFLITKKIMN